MVAAELLHFLNRNFSFLQAPEGIPKDQFYLSMGLVSEQGNALSDAGKWLCMMPSHSLWTFGKDHRAREPPLRLLQAMWKGYEDPLLLEVLGWLITEPDIYRRRTEENPTPHLDSLDRDNPVADPAYPHILGRRLVSGLEWSVRIPLFQMIQMQEAYATEICRVLQFGGVIRHSRFTEFLSAQRIGILTTDTHVHLRWGTQQGVEW